MLNAGDGTKHSIEQVYKSFLVQNTNRPQRVCSQVNCQAMGHWFKNKFKKSVKSIVFYRSLIHKSEEKMADVAQWSIYPSFVRFSGTLPTNYVILKSNVHKYISGTNFLSRSWSCTSPVDDNTRTKLKFLNLITVQETNKWLTWYIITSDKYEK